MILYLYFSAPPFDEASATGKPLDDASVHKVQEMEESRNLILLANSVYFTSLLDTFGWRGEVGSIFVVSIRMTKSSTTTISIDLGRWSP